MNASTRKIRSSAAAVLLMVTVTATALNTGAIVSATLSADCLAYRVVGVCFWLFCTTFGCEVRTSTKVKHYVPDAVVSSYSDTGKNPWTEVASMSPSNESARAGGDGTTNERHENNLAKFKNADVIGHPATIIFNQVMSEYGYICPGAGIAYTPYLLSTLDTLAWRYNIPEMFYPEALTPGLREIGGRLTLDMWGSVYPRGGFLHHVDDHKAAAVVAQRAGDIVTRRGQIHVYRSLLPLLDTPIDGYWPAGALFEGDATTGKWQELVPEVSLTCATFPNGRHHVQAIDGGYAWALWRPYSCCEREGQVLLYSVDFIE